MADAGITPESKNDLSVTNESRYSEPLTFDTIGGTFDDQTPGTFSDPRQQLDNESKNNLSISNESR